MSKVEITEYLEVDLDDETWHCKRCGHALAAAKDNYKSGTLVCQRDITDVHPPLVEGQNYSFTPDPDYCRLLEFYCPKCATLIETEYLPPGHPITHDIELDMEALKSKHAEQGGF